MDVRVIVIFIFNVMGWFQDEFFLKVLFVYFIPIFRIRQDATASLILLWKVTAAGFQQCSLIDGRSVTLLQAPGALVLLEEMLALGPNHFIGELRKSTQCYI